MKLSFKDKKIEKICLDERLMLKEVGEMAKKLKECLLYLQTASCIDELFHSENIKNRTKIHALDHDRKGQYSMWLSGNHRLIFEKFEENSETIIRIIELKKDYH